jgi:periplasmic divalent cation tolerance protein
MQVSHHRLCLCTCPDEKIAQELAHSLVEARLAACVNILPAITSVYMWQGRIEQDGEVLLLIKTSEQRLPDLQAHIVARHPYELPEVIAVPITDGLTGYLQWLDDVMESQT